MEVFLKTFPNSKPIVSKKARTDSIEVKQLRRALKEKELELEILKKVVHIFFKTFKAELIYQHKFTTIEQAKLAVFEYIEVWYNRKRLHSSLSYKTPKEMELAFYKIKSVA